jgi:hypothetical protein
LFFFFAMALHFVVNDNGLRENHKESYDRMGRWILAAAIIVGWVIGQGTEIYDSLCLRSRRSHPQCLEGGTP